jgi:hypothetical protein
VAYRRYLLAYSPLISPYSYGPLTYQPAAAIETVVEVRSRLCVG